MRRTSLTNMTPAHGHSASMKASAPASMSQSLLAVTTAASAGSKRPRTVTAQAEALVLQHQHQPHSQGKDQVVVGIAAATGDDLEDWSEDFMELTPRRSSAADDGGSTSTSARNSERFSGSGGERDANDTATRGSLLRNFQRSTSLFRGPSLGRRSWHRQHSFDSSAADKPRSSRIRRSSNDAGDDVRSSSSLGLSAASSFARESALRSSRTDERIVDVEDDEENEDDDDEEDGDAVDWKLALQAKLSPPEDEDDEEEDDDAGFGSDTSDDEMDGLAEKDDDAEVKKDGDDDEEDDDEDWDVEFGFADPPDDETDELKPGGGSVVDTNRRRTDNFNIFLRGFHDMMAGEDLMDDDDDFGLTRSKKNRHLSEEPLFKRRRSDLHTAPSMDGSAIESTLRTSLTSLPGTSTEYSLVDKFRLLDVACSSSYAVRIERYPKSCVTYSNLERDSSTSAQFPLITDNKLEQWLTHVVRSKCDAVDELMREEQANTPNPRQQKNHQFRTLVSIPFGKRFVDKCFKQISVHRFYGEDKSNRELIRVFFEKLATAGIADEHWSSKLAPAELIHIAGVVMEVLQEAARMYGPVPASGVMTPPPPPVPPSVNNPSASGRASSATAFWMRQFQTILTICVDAFPTYRHLVALIELRFVCHHLVGLANGDLSYTWQICNQYPAFEAVETRVPLAGPSAPIIANDIVNYYGALLLALQNEVEAAQGEADAAADTASGETEPPGPATEDEIPRSVQPSRFCTSTSPHCLLALAVCDIQNVYSSRSALAEAMIPELVEIFEFEDDEALHSYREMGLPFPHEAVAEPVSQATGEAWIRELLKPSSDGRRRALEEGLYASIDLQKEPLIKARCAAVMSGLHSAAAAAAISGGSPHSHMKLAESLAYEALRILDWVTTRRLDELMPVEDESGELQRREPASSVFANDGLLSDLGREILESLGNILVKNQKYRYGILCLEAATAVYSVLNQGQEHERVDRLMCTLTTQADDVKRALPLHEKVAASCLRQGNANEYVFLTQALTSMWLREGKFSRAEEFLASAFHFLRDHTSLLPPFFLSSLAGSHSGSEGSSRSTVLTSSSTVSSSGGSFVYSGSRNTSEMDLWLNHDITLHLLLRDLYRASGRFIEAMRVLEYVLNYSVRLPRGKRTQLRMLLAEDSLQLRVLDTTRYMFHLLDQEANFFCDRLMQSTLGGILGGNSGGGNNSSSGGFGSSSGNAGGSSSGGRSMGGMGSESRFCFDMVLTVRYIVGRAKLFLHLGELRHAYAWLSLAHIKNERESVRTNAKLHVLDGRVLLELLRRQHEQRLFPERTASANQLHKQSGQTPTTSVEDMMAGFASSLYALNKAERQQLHDRLTGFSSAADTAERCLEMGVEAFWAAYDLYQSLDDGHHQLKALLGVVKCQLLPIERAFFALGSNSDDDMLVRVLGACAAMSRRSGTFVAPKPQGQSNGDQPEGAVNEGEAVEGCEEEGDDSIEKVRHTLQECQRLLRQALGLSEQLAEPTSYFRTLVYCSQVWTWLERLAPYKSERPIKEAASFWEEAVKVMKAVFFRRVAFEYDPRNRHSIQQVARSGGLHGPALGGDSSTFSLVPILNFRESVILRLEAVTLQLIMTACQLQQFDRVPEYVEDMLLLHMDEMLSARMCLNSIAHQLRSFRSQQQHQSVVRQIPLYSIPGPTITPPAVAVPKPAGHDIAGAPAPASRNSFSSNSLPGILPSSSMVGASGTKRKGHKKNQSMSSISELLTASSGATTSSFHDLSLSFVSASGRGTALSGGATPRTGLASLSDRSSIVASNGKSSSGCGVMSPESSSADELSRAARERSRSAPHPITPLGSSGRKQSQDFLSPVNENVRVVDLKDVQLWSSSSVGSRLGGEDFANTNGTSSSAGAIGIYDFDDVQSERLWWIFNSWHASKENYISGKTEVSAFRHHNLKTLRMLLDAFDPQQVAVLYTNTGKSPGGMVGFDVAHINSHTFIEDRGFVLSVGYGTQSLRATSTLSAALQQSQQHHSRLEFKVFKAIPDKPSTWRQEIPRADWYLSRDDFFDGSTASSSSGGAVLRTLKLLGAKLLLKIVSSLLLENSLIIVGSSFPLIKEVALCLLKLLRPFRWQHTYVPFLPIPSWRFLADSLHYHMQAQLAGRPKSKMSLSSLSTSDWRWGSPRSATAPSSTRSASSASSGGSRDLPSLQMEDEAPFVIGTLADTWHTCVQRLKTSSTDERVIPLFVNVLNLDDVSSFISAKSSSNAVSFPRKARKQFTERFDKVVKHRRKLQEKMHGLPRHRMSVATGRPGVTASQSMRSSHSNMSQFSEASGPIKRSSKDLSMAAAAAAADDDRAVYDGDCAAAFVAGLHEFYERLCSLSAERAKKLQGKKKHSKRQEIKSWFSSTHDFDAYVDKFLETSMYRVYDATKSSSSATASHYVPEASSSGVGMSGTLSRSNSSSMNTGGGNPRSSKHAMTNMASTSSSTHALVSGASLARSFGSVSSSSSFNGLSTSTSHHQL